MSELNLAKESINFEKVETKSKKELLKNKSSEIGKTSKDEKRYLYRVTYDNKGNKHEYWYVKHY